ncbi:MAG: hypothetical protein IJD22_06960 [Clostridia bacterium]|nr:hypothetical protein [Clostridia bacterium]
MAFIILTAAVMLALYSYSFFANSISFSKRSAKISRISFLVSLSLGVLLCIASVSLYLVLLSSSGADEAERAVINGSMSAFLVTEAIYIGVGAVITVVSVMVGSVFAPVVPIVLWLWSVINLFWTLGWTAWSSFASFNGVPYVIMFGIGATMLLSVAPYFQMTKREKLLGDRGKREELIESVNQKKWKRESKRAERRRIAEKRRKLKHPKR